jgi:hypothetical protein
MSASVWWARTMPTRPLAAPPGRPLTEPGPEVELAVAAVPGAPAPSTTPAMEAPLSLAKRISPPRSGAVRHAAPGVTVGTGAAVGSGAAWRLLSCPQAAGTSSSGSTRAANRRRFMSAIIAVEDHTGRRQSRPTAQYARTASYGEERPADGEDQG